VKIVIYGFPGHKAPSKFYKQLDEIIHKKSLFDFGDVKRLQKGVYICDEKGASKLASLVESFQGKSVMFEVEGVE